MIVDLESTLMKLIQINSVSGKEEEILNHVENLIKRFEIPTERGEKYVCAKLCDNNSKVLHFNGHIDTVSSPDLQLTEDEWKNSPNQRHWTKTYPLTPLIENVPKLGRVMYGLGATNMKASVAALLGTLSAIADIWKAGDLPCDYYFTFVAMEEVDASGTLEFTKSYTSQGLHEVYSNGACVLTEPNEFTEINNAARGNCFLKVITEGISVHSSNPDKGKNAAQNLDKLTESISQLHIEVGKLFTHEALGKASWAYPTYGQAGVSFNVVPSVAYKVGDLRTVQGSHHEAIKYLKKRIHEISENCGIDVVISDAENPCASYYTPEKSEIGNLLGRLLPTAKFCVSNGSNDGFAYSEIGIEPLSIGPGTRDVEHKKDEYVRLDLLPIARDLYRDIAVSYPKL